MVGRLRKPHGLKGDVTLFPLTDDPATCSRPAGRCGWWSWTGRTVAGPLDGRAEPGIPPRVADEVRGVESRDALEPWRGLFLGVPADQLAPLEEDEVYLHELDGFAVRLPDETPLGLVSAVYELPAGVMIEVQGPKREFLLPYKKEFVREVDREGRRLVVTPPEGLIEE